MSYTDIAGFQSLGADINKKKGDETEETKIGVVSEKLPELDLKMSNEDIIKLTTKWEKVWKESPKKEEWEKQIEKNEKYWKGKQVNRPKDINSENPEVDNLIFESVETYLPQATRRNPEPLITLDSTEKTTDGDEDENKTKYVTKVKDRLADIADKDKLRLKLKKGARFWALYHLGIGKFGWDLDKDIPIVRIIRPQKIILDPDATIDEDGYTGDRIGERRKLPAYKILAMIKDNPEYAEAKKIINELVEKDSGTMIGFIEWWTQEYFCWTLGKTVLLKKKNPHWNYDRTEEPDQNEDGSYNLDDDLVNVDEFGKVTTETREVKGINHFPSPKMPYEFISVFNLGDRPMDVTSLINQNLANQDLINMRNKQITKNVDDMNGGMVVSQERSGLTQPQAKNVTKVLRKGGTVIIPTGSPQEAVARYPAQGLPNDVYNQQLDIRNRLMDIFGTRGSSAGGLSTEKTVRGKIMNRGTDTDRIGGGLTEYLEQFADNIYNWYLQMLYVYDADFALVGGAEPPKVLISVKEGSLLPKDSTSIANQAMELASMGKISNIDLFKRLEYPDPEKLASNVWLEQNAPHHLFRDNPLVMEAIAELQAQTPPQEGDNAPAPQEKKEPSKSMLAEVPTQPQV